MSKPQADAKVVKGPKQSTLMGFFGKPKPGPAPTPSSSTPRPGSSKVTSQSTPVASSRSLAKGSSSASIASQGSSSSANRKDQKKPAAEQTKTPVPTKAAKSAPSRPAQSVPTAASPNSTQLQTPSSTTGQSPTVVSSSQSVRRGSSPIKRPSSPLKNKARDDKESSSKAAKNIPTGQDSLEMDIDSDEEPIVTSRRTKRKVVYAESDSDGSVSEGEALRQATGKAKPTRKPRKSLKVDSDSDDYLFEDQDDIAMVNAVDDLEMRQASPSITSVSPPPASKKASGKKFVPPKAAKTKPSERGSSPVASSSRPGPKPLTGMSAGKAGESGKASSRGGPGDSDSWMLTNAERRKLDEKTSKREAQDTYHFLRPDQIRDSFMKRPDDPEYDERTIHIPKKAFESMTPFEKQFWEIKKDHFDTVLFFQKGKFYELYENDAAIGHQEFDLKLTDRVKMSMVGVPEQSFEFWAAKFLAAGYKVGKVEQAETAIGAQMRSKNEGAAGKKKGGDDGGTKEKIVRRELQQVFTNGTIVDGEYLTSDDANHCVAIKEFTDEATGTSSFGICTLDASTGEFNLTAFHDDVIRTRLETMFRQIRPKELIHAKGNLSVPTTRLLRHTLPSSTLWQSFREGREFYSADDTITHLAELFQTNDDPSSSAKPLLPPAIESMLETPLAMEALGGLLFYLKSLNLDKDLVSQKNFNIYDPIKEGKNLVLEGVTLNHMEVLVNNEGGTEGTLLELLQRCQTPFGKRLFRQWLTNPLRDANAINERLDAVDDLMNHTSFTSDFRKFAKELPDLERLISRIHAGQAKQTQFRQVMTAFEAIQEQFSRLLRFAEGFSSHAVAGLIRSAPDIAPHIAHVQGMYHREGDDKAILPNPGANEDCDKATLEVKRLEGEFDDLLIGYQRQLKSKEVKFWHSAQGGKEIYQLQVPAGIKVPSSWAKQSGTKAVSRYYNKDITVLVREFQEAKETENQTKRDFFKFLLAEFDKDQSLWLHTVRVIAELDCLVSLALASFNLDEPKCRPEFVDAPQAFVDFEELRHPSMCLRADFIANDVRLGDDGTGTDGGDEAGARARAVLLTGPNMAGKSTLLRMTAAGIIMAQMGCYVPARKARMSPVDRIQTRMGAYDNMFASASTFKVELDECSKILREAGPRSFVILDELGRGTSTYDGMAIAGAVLHHLATHTLPLAFFATHYGSLTDDYTYHPNIRNMHMKTFVDDARREVVFLYKLIPGVAESSHGTHVAKMAGVPDLVVSRADQVSAEFFMAFKSKLASRRQDALPIVAQADFAWLLKLATGSLDSGDAAGGGEISEMAVDGEDDPVFPGKGVSKLIREKASLGAQLDIIRRAIGAYEVV